MQTRNIVAKHMRSFNKAAVQVDRKKQQKTKPKLKHKNSEEK